MEISRLHTVEENYFVQFEHTSLPRGGLTLNDVHELYNLVVDNRQHDIKIVDVGCWTGQSTCVLANLAEMYGGKVFAIDWFKGSEATNLEWAGKYYNIRGILENNLRQFSFYDKVEIIDAPSTQAVTRFDDNSLDVVFLDADHRYKWIKEDIERWIPKVKPGGILCGHDCEVVLSEGVESLMKVYKDYDTIKEIHLGVCKAVGELGGKKTRDLNKFQPHETLHSSIWYYKKP